MKKVAENGKYLPYPGFTVISFLKDDFREIQSLFDRFPEVCKYYAPLSPFSYHMTIKDFFTLSANPSNWLRMCQNSKLHHGFAKMCHTNLDGLEIKTERTEVYIRNTIGFELKITEGSMKVDTLREELMKVGMFREQGYTFHMTLAYQYRPLPLVSNQKFYEEVAALLKELNGLSKNLTFLSPRYCYFEDMNTYVLYKFYQ